MARVVKKFGGTSVGDMDRIRLAATRVARGVERGEQVTVVVSAMSGVTNTLVDLCQQASANPDPAEYDVILSSGEQVTVGLMAMALQELGLKARSFLGWQLPVTTTGPHGESEIADVGRETLEACMAEGVIPVVAGFQGVSDDGRITTLGRGGSDRSGVAMAWALGAERCDIYTDVPGVYSTDPRIAPKARCLKSISFGEMIEFATHGAKVLEDRAVDFARAKGVRIRVASTFEELPGTLVLPSDEAPIEADVAAVAVQKGFALVVYAGGEVEVTKLHDALLEKGVQTFRFFPTEGESCFALAVREDDLPRFLDNVTGRQPLSVEKRLSKVSAIGRGLENAPEAQQRFVAVATGHGVNVRAVANRGLRTSILVPEGEATAAIRRINQAYDLERD